MTEDREDREGGEQPDGGAGTAEGPRVSPLLLRLFGRHAERRLARHFHAVRLSRGERPQWTAARGRPLVVYLNHSSWWDPLVGLAVAHATLPERRHYASVGAAVLARNPFFERLGFFAVDPGTARGARGFLDTALALLAQPDTVLWITAGGQLCDPRARPVEVQAAAGHLARRLRDGVLLPLALEYPFWGEPLPEALARFGEPVALADAGMSAADWTEVLAAKLESAQDRLAAEATARDPARFELLVGAEPGAAGVHDAWRRLKSRLRGRRLRTGQETEDLEAEP
jgi:1-acyl-sn-glycerol-3-phosphate acyltransferase